MIASRDQPEPRGTATIAGVPLESDSGVEIRRRIAIMPESPGLYDRLSVFENLECFADLYEVTDPRTASPERWTRSD